MFKILLVTKDSAAFQVLQQKLNRAGFLMFSRADTTDLASEIEEQHIDLLLLDIESPQLLSRDSSLWELLHESGQERRLGTIIMVPKNLLYLVDSRAEVSDFVSKPVDSLELEIRIKRCMRLVSKPGSTKLIKSGDLIIDRDKYEVYVAGKPVELTFKEFELLIFLASHKNRVFTREALLNEVWGRDYFGGDRTVDVHIRRLRSKIEDAEHNFIDTVRNIGYKFREAA